MKSLSPCFPSQGVIDAFGGALNPNIDGAIHIGNGKGP